VQGGEGEGTTTGGEAASPEKGGSEARRGKGSGKALTGGSGNPAPPAITASDQELKELQEQSPQEYSESSAKLPDEIATPGKAPPKDHKAPGGGGKGTTIE
jgi:hypothetical protein